jgi:hypothetical protein
VLADLRARELSPDPAAKRLTDFNDLHAAEGLAAVEKQIADALGMATNDGGAKKLTRSSRRRRRSPRSRSDPAEAAGPDPDEPAQAGPMARRNGRSVLGDRRRFTLIYPSDTAYDRMCWRHRAAAAHAPMFGEYFVNLWLATKKRRT